MLTHEELIPDSSAHVKFISYDGKWPNLCMGELTLEIDGEKVTFGYHGRKYTPCMSQCTCNGSDYPNFPKITWTCNTGNTCSAGNNGNTGKNK